MQSLFKKGGRKSKFDEPSERQGFMLCMAGAMQWARLRDSLSNKSFFREISNAVYHIDREHGQDGRFWTDEEMIHFIQNKVFGGIPQYAVEKWIQSICLGKTGDNLRETMEDIIENFLYRYLSVAASGVDGEGRRLGRDLAARANIDAILQYKPLGGALSGTWPSS